MTGKNTDKIIQKLLTRRGILPQDLETFLHPDFKRDVHGPHQFKDMAKATEILAEAIKAQKSIGIFGDYDADGLPAVAVLVRALEPLGAQLKTYIPTRSAGYGLSEDLVRVFVKEKVKVLITVDNGTVAKSEIALLEKAGIPVIVCDHHEAPREQLAQPSALLNPKIERETYPEKMLCGCAIAWKLAWALYEKVGKSPNLLKWDLDLVALATVADMVPLLGENRTLTYFGLQIMQRTRNLGLRALADGAEQDLTTVSTGGIGFRLAPRLNAPSRMHQEEVDGVNAALQLLITKDKQEAIALASYLNEQNAARQTLVEQHLLEAEELVASRGNSLGLVLYQEHWSSGVIGLVAGRLQEKYQRPVIVLAKEGTSIKGSVRTSDPVHVLTMLDAVSSLFLKYGGHARAGGLTLMPEIRVEQLELDVIQWLDGQDFSLEQFAREGNRSPDLELTLSDVTISLIQALNSLEPFGIGFPRPLFSSKVSIERVRRVGATGQHLACYLREGLTYQKAIWFNASEINLEIDHDYTVEYRLEIDRWQNQELPVCQIQTIK